MVEFDLSSDHVAYFFSIYTLSACATNILLTFFPIKRCYMLWIVMSLMVSVLSVLLMGPSPLFEIPDSLLVMGVGLEMLGVARQIYMVALPIHTL